MHKGKSLQEIAVELDRQRTSRKDFIAPQGKVEVKVVEGEVVNDKPVSHVVLAGLNGEPKQINRYAHKQMADLLKIPVSYYERMLAEQPKLLADNLNTWLHADPSNKRMIRTLDNRVRAVLSPKYRPLDNFDLASAVLPKLAEMRAEVVSTELTETRLYIKAIIPSLSDELPGNMQWGVGHNAVAATGGRTYGRDGRLVSAIVISNSDVGAGTLRVEPSVFTTWCTNLAIMMQAAMKKYHVGRAFAAEEDFSIYRDETRAADDKAFWLKVQDVVAQAFSEDAFKAAVRQIREAASTEIVSKDLPTVVVEAVEQLALPPASSDSILSALARGGDLTKWGLSSAITQVAGDTKDYELATAMERAGGEILVLDGPKWERISKAEKKAA